MNGIIIYNKESLANNKNCLAGEFIKEFSEYSIKLEAIAIDDILIEDKKLYNLNTELKDIEFAIIRSNRNDWKISQIQSLGVKCINSSQCIRISKDKYLTYQSLKEKVLQPKTIMTKHYDKDNEEKSMNFPCVQKYRYGSKGDKVTLINYEDEIIDNEDYILQEYIEDACGIDTRVLVVGGEIIGAYRRTNPEDFRSNLSIGGKSQTIEVSDRLKALCLQVVEITKMDICGIDVLEDKKGNLYVCEINSNPGFKGLYTEATKGVNYVKKIVDALVGGVI